MVERQRRSRLWSPAGHSRYDRRGSALLCRFRQGSLSGRRSKGLALGFDVCDLYERSCSARAPTPRQAGIAIGFASRPMSPFGPRTAASPFRCALALNPCDRRTDSWEQPRGSCVRRLKAQSLSWQRFAGNPHPRAPARRGSLRMSHVDETSSICLGDEANKFQPAIGVSEDLRPGATP